MKNINYVFYTGVVIIIFLIVSPIYWQYEVNEFHDAPYFYQINDFEGQTVEESYQILESNIGGKSNTFYIVRPTSVDNIDLQEEKYCFNYNGGADNYTVENAIRFSTRGSDLTSFSQTNGYFYSDIPYKEWNVQFSSQGVSLTEREDIYENDLSRYLYDNALPILVVIIYTFIMSIILTLKDVKEVAILSLQGVSAFKIKLRLTYRTFKRLSATVLLVFGVFFVHKLVKGNHLSPIFFKFYFIVVLSILAVYTLLYFISLLMTSSVNIVNVLKNKDYSKPVYLSLLVIQVLIIIFVPILFSNYKNNYENVKYTKKEISRVYELENYYTYYGMNANYYDSCTDEELNGINGNFKQLYNDNIDTSYYFEPVFTQYTERYGESIYQMPIENVVYMDINYYNKIAHFSKNPVEKIENGVVLIPFSFQESTNEIIDSLVLKNKEEMEVVYIDDGIELYFDDYYSEYGFNDIGDSFGKKGVNNVIVITSPNYLENMNPSAETIFIEKMTLGSIFFERDSLQSMMELTQEYQIDKMVTAESKISPYKNMLYNMEYTYRIITYTLAITLIAVFVVNSFAVEIIVNNKKKLIAIGFLYGKNILFSLKNNFVLYTIVSVVSVGILYVMQKLTIETFGVVLVLYLYICLYLAFKYLNFVNKRMSTLLKGE